MFDSQPTSASHRMRFTAAVAFALMLPLSAGVALAGTVQVKLKLPVRAALDLTGRNKLVVAPFQVVRQEGERTFRGKQLDVKGDFQRYLIKVLKRDSGLDVEEVENVEYPSDDCEALAHDRDFWRALGERTSADLLLAGSLDFDVQDKSGYRTEEYVSPFDGRTYYRQVLVEQTGFDFDIVLMVFDGRTGARLYFDNFKDFKEFEGEKTDPLKGMFENLASLEDRILNVFTQKTVETSRMLLTD